MSAGTIAREAAQLFRRYFTTRELMDYLSLGSEDAVSRLVKDGLPAIRLGRGARARFRFDRLRVDAWLAEREVAVSVVDAHALTVVRRAS